MSAGDNAAIFERGEGVRREARGSVMLFKALAGTTEGRLSLMERTLPPGGRMPPPHRHAGNDEAYFVLDGEVTFILDGETRRGGPETFVLVPAGVGHTFGNASDRPARLLVLHSPALDGYFADLAELWSGEQPPTPEQERALMARHGMEPA
ncbi:cupin domain-containing protein [Plantactinospora siamensis]|uniref:Cupin domain-containing protein n=1 Tax=Plantactinospora siamensis TaxID=555372 RepID=A0ABV6P3F9_9ACTN